MAEQTATLSARGTRLNRKGRETRDRVLRSAVRSLATGDPEAASANAVAREAGVTWGAVQHLFGDLDGLWAALLDELVAGFAPAVRLPAPTDLETRVRSVVGALWALLSEPGPSAIGTLRASLPRQRDLLEQSYPRTAAALARWDAEWTLVFEESFRGLPVDPVRLMRVRAMLPGALRGMHEEEALSTYLDADEARAGLVEAVVSYLRS